MQTLALDVKSPLRSAQPNELDLRRIERSLRKRRRYRYVRPRVFCVGNGYRVESPCCSRSIDPDGGPIDVALMRFDEARGEWRLFHKNHRQQSWELHSCYCRLADLLDVLNADSKREFWQ